jgi:hypothetical protein
MLVSNAAKPRCSACIAPARADEKISSIFLTDDRLIVFDLNVAALFMLFLYRRIISRSIEKTTKIQQNEKGNDSSYLQTSFFAAVRFSAHRFDSVNEVNDQSQRGNDCTKCETENKRNFGFAHVTAP